MGREIKRVPFDFNWPLNKVWEGYINPYLMYVTNCSACEGTGYSNAAKYFYDQWYGHTYFHPSYTGSEVLTPDTPVVRQIIESRMDRYSEEYSKRLCELWNNSWSHHLDQNDVNALLENNRLWELTHNGHIPTAQEVNEWSLSGFGHDVVNQWICVRAKCERLAIELQCDVCAGSGEIWESEYYEQLYEQWEPVEPPNGAGWQLWENISEGSPISPVFKSEKGFRNYLLVNGYSPSAVDGFIEQGWAFTATITPEHGFRANIETLATGNANERTN